MEDDWAKLRKRASELVRLWIDDTDAQSAIGWFNAEYSEAAVRARREAVPDMPDDRQHRLSAVQIPGVESGRPAEVWRLSAALMDLHDRRLRPEFGFGSMTPRGERRTDAFRVLLVVALVSDRDSHEYLGSSIDLANLSLGGDDERLGRWFAADTAGFDDGDGSWTQMVWGAIAEIERTPPRLWFDDTGRLNQFGPVALSDYVAELCNQLEHFLARLNSCERTDTGGYLLRDARAGNLGGMRVLWDNVVLLAQASIAKTLPGMTPDQHAAMKRDGIFVTTTGPTRNAQPLADALRQLLFSILYNADGSWVSEIPSATVAKIRTIGDELTQHRTACERSEGGPTRTPTVSVSPVLLDRLEAGIAAVSSIGSNFDAGLARVERVVESLGARDADDAPAAKLPGLKAHDRQAWQLATLHGMTQVKVAVALNTEHGTNYTQGQVSRMIARAKTHADANGLAEKVAGPINRPRTVDPRRLELGARVDKRKPRPSDMARASDDDE